MKSFVAILCLVAIASATKFDDCGSTTGQVTSVQVSDCPDSEDTCILKRGTTKTITIGFGSKTATSSVKAVVHGVISGVPLPFSLPKADGCQYGGLACPLENGKSYTYTNKLEIKNSYPPLSVHVRWELKDDKKGDIVCVEIPCQIQ